MHFDILGDKYSSTEAREGIACCDYSEMMFGRGADKMRVFQSYLSKYTGMNVKDNNII